MDFFRRQRFLAFINKKTSFAPLRSTTAMVYVSCTGLATSATNIESLNTVSFHLLATEVLEHRFGRFEPINFSRPGLLRQFEPELFPGRCIRSFKKRHLSASDLQQFDPL
jgi:hypothetical protein